MNNSKIFIISISIFLYWITWNVDLNNNPPEDLSKYLLHVHNYFDKILEGYYESLNLIRSTSLKITNMIYYINFIEKRDKLKMFSIFH